MTRGGRPAVTGRELGGPDGIGRLEVTGLGGMVDMVTAGGWGFGDETGSAD